MKRFSVLVLALFVGNSFAESYSYAFSAKPKNMLEVKGAKEGIFSVLPRCEDIKIWKNCYGEKYVSSDKEGFYLGEWKDNKTFHGRGNFVSAGHSYIGDWKNNKRHGKGIYESTSPKEKYIGDWQNDKKHGQGFLTSFWGTYDGEWKNNSYHGFGTKKDKDGDKYSGGWKNNFYHGYGTKQDKDGNKYSGQWQDGFLLREDNSSNKLSSKVNSEKKQDDTFVTDIFGAIVQGFIQGAVIKSLNEPCTPKTKITTKNTPLYFPNSTMVTSKTKIETTECPPIINPFK